MDTMLPDNLLEVVITDVSITNVGFAIFFKPVESTSGQVVPIFIGPLETYSISSALDGITPPRPNTHDLLVNLLQEMDAKVLHVIINDIIGNVFYARIIIQTDDGIIEMDARPSDSVAISIRTKCPIYMHEKVYQEASVLISSENEAQEPTNQEETQSEPKSKLESLKRKLDKAVASENFEQAAILRDEINKITQDN